VKLLLSPKSCSENRWQIPVVLNQLAAILQFWCLVYVSAEVEVFKNCVSFSSGLPRRHLQIAAILARLAGL
jgi:hypothetical protein